MIERFVTQLEECPFRPQNRATERPLETGPPVEKGFRSGRPHFGRATFSVPQIDPLPTNEVGVTTFSRPSTICILDGEPG